MRLVVALSSRAWIQHEGVLKHVATRVIDLPYGSGIREKHHILFSVEVADANLALENEISIRVLR